jgi:hypothetical protein
MVDLGGLRRFASRRGREAVIADVTAVVVFVVGVEEGIVLAVILSLVELVRRQYMCRPNSWWAVRRGCAGLRAGGPGQPEPARAGDLPV